MDKYIVHMLALVFAKCQIRHCLMMFLSFGLLAC